MNITENEAKYYLLEHKPIVGFKTHNEALDVAINALEEIQQYRAIGTVEELTELIKELKETYKIISEVRKLAENKIAELKEFQSIGTVEEFKALKECFGHTTPKSRGKAIYDKAIDDFAKELKEICKNHPISNDGHTPLYIHEDGTYHELIEDAVKQMKGGAV